MEMAGLSWLHIGVKYAAFAGISIAANLATQNLMAWGWRWPYELYVSMAAGTGVGLWVKYVLDKRFIFYFKARDLAHDGRTFVLYTLVGVLTTIIFWGFELSFDFALQTKAMRYTGATLGLVIGYFLKYRLDKRFVFRGGAWS